MKFAWSSSGWPQLFRRFRSATDGVTAIEFALVLPILLTGYFGLVAVTNAVANKQRVALISHTVADLTGRLSSTGSSGTQPTVNATEIDNVVSAAAVIMAPYDAAGLAVTVASVVIKPQGTGVEARVCWSASRAVASDGTLTEAPPPADLAPNVVYPLPNGAGVPNTSIIVSEVRHVYRPVVGHAITGDLDLTTRSPWPVRGTQQVAWQGQGPC